jgi:hypothetical protein
VAVRNGYDQTFEEAQAESDHPQARALTPEGVEVHVDAALAPLLTELWKLGYETRYSCEGGEGKNKEDRYGDDREGYIYFENLAMGFYFVQMIKKEITEPIDQLWRIDSGPYSTIRFDKSMIPAFERAVRNYGEPI